jgi:peptidoglycan/LPS O-acetylase OafA/YrhL
MHTNKSDAGVGKGPASNQHLLFLDGLRGLAALFVTIHHMWLHLWPQAQHVLPAGLMMLATGWLGYGHFGVTVFIVLSGFSLALAAAKRNTLTPVDKKSFYMRRARRILPPYYWALLFSCLLAVTLVAKPTGTHWDVSLPVTIPGLVSHLLMMQDMFYIPQINHTFWSVALEWKMYFLFPFIVTGCLNFGPFKTVAACTALGYAGVILLHGTPYNNFPIHFVGLFVMGIAAALIVFSPRSDWQKLSRPSLMAGIGSASLIVVLAASGTHYMRGLFYTDLFVALATVIALMQMSVGRWRLLGAVLTCRPLVFIGSFSYSLYLIHAPLIQCVWQYLVHPLGVSKNAEFFLLFLIGVPLILVCAYVFYLACERPFVRSQKQKQVEATATDAQTIGGAPKEMSVAHSLVYIPAQVE